MCVPRRRIRLQFITLRKIHKYDLPKSNKINFMSQTENYSITVLVEIAIDNVFPVCSDSNKSKILVPSMFKTHLSTCTGTINLICMCLLY